MLPTGATNAPALPADAPAGGLSTGLLAAIIGGPAGALILIAFLLACYAVRRNRSSKPDAENAVGTKLKDSNSSDDSGDNSRTPLKKDQGRPHPQYDNHLPTNAELARASANQYDVASSALIAGGTSSNDPSSATTPVSSSPDDSPKSSPDGSPKGTPSNSHHYDDVRVPIGTRGHYEKATDPAGELRPGGPSAMVLTNVHSGAVFAASAAPPADGHYQQLAKAQPPVYEEANSAMARPHNNYETVGRALNHHDGAADTTPTFRQ